MIDHIHKRHNKTLLVYHLVCPVKFRRKVFTPPVEQTLKDVCLELGILYEIRFLEIGIDTDHVHFLIQLVPNQTLSQVVKKIKSITAREIFDLHTEVKDMLWAHKFWTMGFYANTVGQYGNLAMLSNYVKKQGIKDYTQLHHQTLSLFE
jgi:putative transposase